MEKKIIMKTNMDKTATGAKVVAPPRPARALDRILAGLIDAGMLYVCTTLTLIVFKPLASFELPQFLAPKVLIFVYYYFLLYILPNSFFSQSLGKFFMKLKVVRKENYRRLTLIKTLFRDILYKPLVLLMPWTLGNAEGSAVHDKLTDSVVVIAA